MTAKPIHDNPDGGPVTAAELVPGDELLFVPLGGCGEIGMNLNLYGTAGQWLMVDLGVTFGDDSTPGIDVIMPDPAFIEAATDDLAGLVLTHAHEDHIGAVPHLWERLKCPLYATSFTASILRRKLREAGLEMRAPITEIPLSGKFDVGPFSLELITLTHSIPEPNAVVIRTSHGTVLHTGDWKFDPDPLVGSSSDKAALRKLGDEDVLAMVCDSTNVFTEGESGSEGDLRKSLTELVSRYTRGRVAAACFASNVARLETMAHVAEANGRHAALIGRSLWNFYEASKENGYLTDIPPFLTEHDVGRLPPEKIFLVCTGSQGEPRAAMARIASLTHPRVELGDGDVVIFSSRIIPGNEKSIARLQNQLVRLGVDVVTEKDHFIHVSGHPARDELTHMYEMVRPHMVVPVHGELRHLREQAKLAKSCQIPEAPEIVNGQALRLAPGDPNVVAEVVSGRLVLDGNRLIDIQSSMVRARRRMILDGTAAVTVVVDAKGYLVADPVVSAPGIIDDEGDDILVAELVRAVTVAVENLPVRERRKDAPVHEAARLALRRTLVAQRGHKPVTQVHVVRV